MNGDNVQQTDNQNTLGAVNRRNLFRHLSHGFKCAAALPLLPITTGISTSLASLPAKASRQPDVLQGNEIHLTIGYQDVNISGTTRRATTINGSLPGPTLHWKEDEEVTLHVTNRLDTTSSIHWHGIILPYEMDGVPGLSFDGIPPGQTFTYRFTPRQTGTYWYHSHSGFQEQTGVYGGIVIEGKDTGALQGDREHIVMLSDWSDQAPESIYATLKKVSHYYNRQERTLRDTFADIKAKGFAGMWQERKMWNTMRMSDRDIADVTGYTYHYLMNGNTNANHWQGLFSKDEKIRLRFINASAMTLFDVRIPGLKMIVVAADGQPVKPVAVDEFRIGTAETYDVIVKPKDDKAYTIFAQSIDRSGFIWGSLTPRDGETDIIPEMDPPVILTHGDMGMDHSAMSHGGTDHSAMNHNSNANENTMDHSHMNHGEMDHSAMDPTAMSHATMNHDNMNQNAMNHSTMNHQGMDHSAMMSPKLGLAGMGSNADIIHAETEKGPQTDMQTAIPVNGINDPGIGLRQHKEHFGRRVLTYSDLRNYYPTQDKRQPSREIQLHLTGNMARYMWSFDGVGYADSQPIILKHGERIRITLVNDTMMTHPIHLHGLWSELETGDPDYIPRKHTILVQPGKKVSYLVTADALGRWAYHCHLLYHMAGMMREVRVEAV